MALPEQLKEIVELKRWVCYRDKVPKNPVTGSNAMANEADTWGTYEEALSGLRRFNFTGIGFQFGLPLSETDALGTERVTGIDLDNVIREDGTLEPFASEIIALMNSYTEISPLGTGIHILCKGKLPNIGRKRYIYIVPNPTKFIIEMYNYSHYFTVTGNVYGEAKEIASRTEELKILYEKYFVEHKAENPVVSSTPQPVSIPPQPHSAPPIAEYFPSEDLTDSELLERMFASRNGYYIRSLFGGNISSHSSHSEADLALVSNLAYWTNGDASRIDALFRQSGLMRDKWNERHGAQTYGEMTISKVLSSFSPYNTFTRKVNSNTPKHTNALLKSLEDASSAQISGNITDTGGIVPNDTPIASRNIRSYIHGIIDDWQLQSDLSRFRKFADRKTGFSNIDSHVSFYPGLYVLGAISSLGKTTFIHQMADQLVMAGEHVLFFSLEQTCLELVTKGISRLMAMKDINTAVSAIDIRRGVESEEVLRATEEYASFTEHEILLECNFETNIGDIISTVEQYIKENSVLRDCTQNCVFIESLYLCCLETQRAFKELTIRCCKSLLYLRSVARTCFIL